MTRPTKDELQGVRPDPDPNIPCDGCGENFRFKDYWEPRCVDGDRVDDINNRDSTWRCDECHKRHERQTRRRENNEKITRYTS